MDNKTFLVIRIRGGLDTPYYIEDTLKMLRIEKNNYATLLRESPSYIGMLRKAKDYITWGELSIETLRLILEKRGKLEGDESITDKSLASLGYENIDKLTQSIYSGELDFNQLKGIKPFFRLHPPKRGFKRTVKRPFKNKGELGYRGEAIDELVRRMS